MSERHRAVWTDHPSQHSWDAPVPAHVPEPTLHTRHADDRPPIAVIHLPRGAQHPVFGRPRERIGFKRG
jgi:hypothetical protein